MLNILRILFFLFTASSIRIWAKDGSNEEACKNNIALIKTLERAGVIQDRWYLGKSPADLKKKRDLLGIRSEELGARIATLDLLLKEAPKDQSRGQECQEKSLRLIENLKEYANFALGKADGLGKFLSGWQSKVTYTQSPTPKPEISSNQSPKGIKNCGNSCYINSSLQFLLASNLLKEKIKSSSTNNKIAKATAGFFQGENDQNSTPTTLMDLAGKLHTSVSDEVPSLKGSGQQDAEEFLSAILSVFAITAPVQEKTILYKNSEKKIRPIKKDKLGFISLGIHKETTLADLLNNFSATEKVAEPDNQLIWDDLTNSKSDYFTKEIYLTEPPPKELFIQLKRLVFGEKINTKIMFPNNQKIDTSIFENKSKKYPYNIIATVIHRGSHQGGHYFAYIKKANQWYKCDDDKVSLVDYSEVKNVSDTGAYLILLQKS